MFHGVFAPNSKHCFDVPPVELGNDSNHHNSDEKTPE
jgi:hypothetical protein